MVDAGGVVGRAEGVMQAVQISLTGNARHCAVGVEIAWSAETPAGVTLSVVDFTLVVDGAGFLKPVCHKQHN